MNPNNLSSSNSVTTRQNANKFASALAAPSFGSTLGLHKLSTLGFVKQIFSFWSFSFFCFQFVSCAYFTNKTLLCINHLQKNGGISGEDNGTSLHVIKQVDVAITTPIAVYSSYCAIRHSQANHHYLLLHILFLVVLTTFIVFNIEDCLRYLFCTKLQLFYESQHKTLSK